MPRQLQRILQVEVGDGERAARKLDRRRASKVTVEELGVQRSAHEHDLWTLRRGLLGVGVQVDNLKPIL